MACLARKPYGAARDVAEAFGVPSRFAASLVAELHAAGMIEPEPVQ